MSILPDESGGGNSPDDHVTLIEAVLFYLSIGLSVLPLWWVNDDGTCGCKHGRACEGPGKHPILDGGVLHASGRRYRWLRSPSEGIASAPQWLVDLLRVDEGKDEGGDKGTRRGN